MRRTIDTKAIIEDIRSGMGDIPIMEKYGLSPTEFFKVLDKLESVKAVSQTAVRERKEATRSLAAPPPPPTPSKRKKARSYALFSIAIQDAENLGISGTINDITEQGIQVTGIAAKVGDVKTLVIRSDVFTVHPPLVLKAACRWTIPGWSKGAPVSGFEITTISKDDLKALRDLIDELTITPGGGPLTGRA